MKKFIASLIVVSSLIALPALAFPTPCNAYCHVYNYPDGSYWVQQKAAQQARQAAYDAVYKYPTGAYWVNYNSIYGQGGLYCTLYGYNC